MSVSMSSESSLPHDPVTALPWSSALLPSAASLALSRKIHVVYLQLNRLAEVGLLYGDRVAQLLFRQVVRRLRFLLDQDDLMGRHTDNSLLILTTRPPAELQRLASSILQQVKSAAILTRGSLLPEARIGMANVRQAADQRDAIAAIEAAVTAAEQSAPLPEAIEGPHAPPGMAEAVPSPKESIEPVEGPREVPVSPRPLGQFQRRPPAVRAAPAPAPGEPSIVIRRIGIVMEGAAATAMITLALRSREVEAEARGKNTPEDRLALVGEVTAMAVTNLLPKGHTVSPVSIDELSQEDVRLVRAVIKISGPGGSEQVSATVPVQATTYSTAARAVVQAVEPHVREILKRMPIQ